MLYILRDVPALFWRFQPRQQTLSRFFANLRFKFHHQPGAFADLVADREMESLDRATGRGRDGYLCFEISLTTRNRVKSLQ
jgi:hypothetical protein